MMADTEVDLDALQAETARIAREVAGELIRPDPDLDRVAMLDAEIKMLRAIIKERTPSRPDYELSAVGRTWPPLRDRWQASVQAPRTTRSAAPKKPAG